jgi:hypothetical protein
MFLKSQKYSHISSLPDYYSEGLTLPRRIFDEVSLLQNEIFIELERISTEKNSDSRLKAVPAHLRELVKNAPANKVGHPVFRTDFLYDQKNEQLKLLEINSSDPSGFGIIDALNSEFKGEDSSIVRITEKYIDYIMINWPNARKILGVIEESTYTRFDFEWLKLKFIDRGVAFDLYDPRHSSIALGLGTYDLVIRDYLEEIVTPDKIQNLSIYNFLLKSNRVMNPISSTLGDLKFNLIEIENNIAERSKSLRRYFLNSRSAGPAAVLMSCKSDIVLKKSYSYGGNGVFIGSRFGEKAWRGLCEEANKKPNEWIVQDFFESKHLNYFVTLSIWHIGNKYAGDFGRISREAIVNVSQGGAMFPITWRPHQP